MKYWIFFRGVVPHHWTSACAKLWPVCALMAFPLGTQEPRSTLQKLARFLGHPLSPQEEDMVLHHSSFAFMSQSSVSNYSLVPREVMDQARSSFMRKGRARALGSHADRRTTRGIAAPELRGPGPPDSEGHAGSSGLRATALRRLHAREAARGVGACARRSPGLRAPG